MLCQIERSDEISPRKSKDLLLRIKKRNLYKFVTEIIIDDETKEKFTKAKEADIADYGNNLSKEDIILTNYDLNYGCGKNNPVDFVHFYKDNNDTSEFYKNHF